MPGLLRGVARTAVVAGTWTAVSNGVSRRQAGRWAAQDQAHQQQGYMPPPPGRYQRPMFQPPAHQQQPPGYQPPPPQYQQQPAYAQPAPAPAPGGTPPAGDDMDSRLLQLRQLGELQAQGILTQEEFEAQKRKILGA
jgi:hypothetical protein